MHFSTSGLNWRHFGRPNLLVQDAFLFNDSSSNLLPCIVYIVTLWVE